MKIITGIQAQVMGSSVEEITRYLDSKEAYVVARIDNVEYLRWPVKTLPLVNPDGPWLDLGPRGLSVLETRFDCPAFVTLKFRIESISKRSSYGWSSDPETDRELQKKYGDSVHKPKQ